VTGTTGLTAPASDDAGGAAARVWPSTSPITYRRANEADFTPTYDVMLRATGDLNRQHARLEPGGSHTPQGRAMVYRRFALRHDGDRFWVAEAGDEVVGFGVATQRDHVWHLTSLHVVPELQGRGVGRELLRRCMAAAPPGTNFTTISDAVNPVSNALYGRLGMLPQAALLYLEGPTQVPDVATRLTLRPFAAGRPDPALLDPVDLAVLGVHRHADHESWAATPTTHGYTVLRRGVCVGYAYADEKGPIGPIAVRRPEDLAPAVLLALGEAHRLGAPAATLRIPAPARSAISVLLDLGFRYGEAIMLLLTQRPWGRLDRYVSSPADALF